VVKSKVLFKVRIGGLAKLAFDLYNQISRKWNTGFIGHDIMLLVEVVILCIATGRFMDIQ